MTDYFVYVELNDLKSVLEITDTVDDQELTSFIFSASRLAELMTDRKFAPKLSTVLYDHPSSNCIGLDGINPYSRLMLYADLLELNTLTTNNGGTTITSSDYHLAQWGDLLRYDRTPYNIIQLDPDGTYTVFEYNQSRLKANSITGVWGYHQAWADAWLDTGDTVLDAPLSSSETSITVSDADGLNIHKQTRFSPLQLLRIESEYVFVTAVNTTTNILTVVREVNGTTAASHVASTTIESYQVDHGISNVILSWAIYLHKQGKFKLGGSGNSALGTRSLQQFLGEERLLLLNRYDRTTL